MCVRLMGKIFDNSDLPPGERFTLLALADHADDSGRCFPSIARLAKGTGYNERAIQGHLKTLERRGVVKVAKGAGPNGVNVFAISLPPADFAPPPRFCAIPPQILHPNHQEPPKNHQIYLPRQKMQFRSSLGLLVRKLPRALRPIAGR